jgi:hypothetical protein
VYQHLHRQRYHNTSRPDVHHVQHVDQFLATGVVTPLPATSSPKSILSRSGVYGCFLYLSVHALLVTVRFTLSGTEAVSLCLHPGDIHLSQDAESVICVHVVDVHNVFYI